MMPWATGICALALVSGASAASASEEAQMRSIRQVDPTAAPGLGCWFWMDADFEPGTYTGFIEAVAGHTSFDILTTSIRADRELTEDAVLRQVTAAAAYAQGHGVGIAMDLDVRLARRAFRERYPAELQEMLRLREVALPGGTEAVSAVESSDRGDHYTFNTVSYVPLAGRLVRVYAYRRGPEGIVPASVRDVTAAVTLDEATASRVRVRIPAGAAGTADHACVMAAFAHLTPDAFAPHLLAFQRELVERYRDAPLAGTCKDEWGFPPCFDGCPAKDDYWYSDAMSDAYGRRTRRDLVRDCLLMTFGEAGRSRQREAAVNDLFMLSVRRHAQIEADFYRVTKRVFGRDAYVGTHPTWFPIPDSRELTKNGLVWWMARRDLAQTDESTPYAARNALAKRWRSGTWHNMFYSPSVDDYRRQMWSNALSGGRTNFHPLYPVPTESIRERHRDLLRGGMMLGASRIRLLDLVTRAPLDSPVALVFGHASAANWAGTGYADVGLELAAAIWRRGYAVDLIPSTEVGARTLSVGADGRLRYGQQAYGAVVVYHPQYEGAGFARVVRAATRGPAPVFHVGAWRAGPTARPFDGAEALTGATPLPTDPEAAADRVADALERLGLRPGYAAVERTDASFGREAAVPPDAGTCRLLDGTEVVVSGRNRAEGDPIVGPVRLCGATIDVDAVGLAALRLGRDGRPDALVACGLRRWRGAGLDIALDAPVDVALWRDRHGLRGVVMGCDGAIPPPLLALTARWQRVRRPSPLQDGGGRG